MAATTPTATPTTTPNAGDDRHPGEEGAGRLGGVGGGRLRGGPELGRRGARGRLRGRTAGAPRLVLLRGRARGRGRGGGGRGRGGGRAAHVRRPCPAVLGAGRDLPRGARAEGRRRVVRAAAAEGAPAGHAEDRGAGRREVCGRRQARRPAAVPRRPRRRRPAVPARGAQGAAAGGARGVPGGPVGAAAAAAAGVQEGPADDPPGKGRAALGPPQQPRVRRLGERRRRRPALPCRGADLGGARQLRRVAASAAAAAGASAGAAAPTAVRTAMMAMVLVELLAAAARALESQLRARSQDLMARSIQVRLFEALVAKDMTWWGGQKEPWANINKVICLPAQVESALAAPRTLVNRISTISIQFALVRQRSSRMLYAMLLMHWAKFGVNEVVSRLLSWFQRRSVRGLVMPSQDKFTWIYALSPEYIRLYQSFARGPNEALDLKRYLCGNNRQQELTGAVSSLAKPVMAVISQACTVVELNTMGSLMDEGTLDISQAETVMQYASGVARDSESTYWDITAFQDKLSPLARAWDFVALPPKIVLDRGFVPEGRAKGHFVFEGVHFHYPGRRSKILRGTSFEVKPGQVVGITGTTGCGKSTCLSLVERFFDVTKGRILLDGRDIREYQPRWLRSQIVAVSQEPKLLPLTIRDNLVFGCDHDPTLEEIEQACRAANIWDSLTDPQKFPNGLETQMTVAQNVAGGEKQRLCIARAILANPPILLLDEATSALDEVSQAQVQEALNKLMAGRTTLAASSAAARKS
ncbi:unnamed protein product [Prorocentrum cordatum]|uniref:ABC transporter domain-containing protein n=1 Tax=Prorocentrum cordatum TaxID=2364126 RepID=A0ABN9X8Z4_9DINO|nr:unnamed protein product [Polarella glacialis]